MGQISRSASRLAIIAILFAFAFASVRPAFAEIPPAIRAEIDEIASQPVHRGDVPALIAGVISGHDRMIRAFGQAAPGAGDRPTPTTEWELGSITKTFTATLLALYVHRGLVHYDDPLSKYLPSDVTVPVWHGRRITLLDLATHTSGLPANPDLKDVTSLSLARMYRMLSAYRLTRAPGAKYQYSNWGFALLAAALARAADADYQHLVEREICVPLGMTDTRIDLTDAELARLAQGYNRAGKPRPRDNAAWPAFDGSTGLKSTMNDMMRYLAFNLGETATALDVVLPDLHRRWRRTGHRGRWIGLGWQIERMPGTHHSIVWKTGEVAGFYNYIGMIPDTQTGVIIFANRKIAVARIGMRILRALNGVSNKIRGPASRTSPSYDPNLR